MKAFAGLAALVLLLALPSLPRAADTRYVTDQLVLTVRADKTPGAEILTTLQTDAPVEVLAEENGYLKVRTADGVQGYVQAQYITKETPKPVIIDRLEGQIASLRQQLEKIRQSKGSTFAQVEALQGEKAALEAELTEVREQLEAVRQRHQTLKQNSQQVLDIMAERDQLQSRNNKLVEEAATLREENEQLLRTGMIRWFLAGAGVLLAGWIMGKSSRKKRRGF